MNLLHALAALGDRIFNTTIDSRLCDWANTTGDDDMPNEADQQAHTQYLAERPDDGRYIAGSWVAADEMPRGDEIS